MNKKVLSYLINIVPWVIIVILFEVRLPFPSNTPWQIHAKLISTLLLIIPIYYLNSRVLIPRFFFKKKIALYFILLIAVGAIGYYLSILISWSIDFESAFREIEKYFEEQEDDEGGGNDIFFFLGVPALLYSSIVATATNQRKQHDENERLLHEKTVAELAQLRGQLNPHFLFNTLNNIYALIEVNPSLAQEKTHELSGLLRYVLYEANEGYVSVKSEMEFIKKYVNLMRIRLSSNTHVSIDIAPSVGNGYIQALLFIPLVENAFKHGINPNGESNIDISVSQEKDILSLRIDNSIHKSSEISASEGGIGLKNTAKRIALFPNSERYVLDVKETDGTYIAQLSIPCYDQMPSYR